MKEKTEKIEFYLEGICELPAYQRQLVDDVVNHADTITLQPGRYLPAMLEVLVAGLCLATVLRAKPLCIQKQRFTIPSHSQQFSHI